MFKKIYRITKKKDFENIFKLGDFLGCPLFKLRILPNKMPHSRFAVVVSTKTSKKATVRNLYQRRINSFLRTNISSIKPGNDIVIIVQKPWKEAVPAKAREMMLDFFIASRLTK